MDAQWRAWIGPRWRESNETGAEKWLEIVSTAITLAEQATTLSGALVSGATSASLTNGASYPAANGWAFVGPNGAGQGWEYVDYTSRATNTLSGLTRESTSTREHDGNHSSGAAVRLLWPLTTDDGTLSLVEQTDEAQAMINWQATLRGVQLPQVALRHAHLVAVEWRQSASADWEMLLVGWVDTAHIQDDERRRADWQITLLSAPGLVAAVRIDGVRVGAYNWAEHGSISGDTTLAQASKEAASGDFAAAAPDLSHASAIDGDEDTLWIGERLIGATDGTLPGGFTSFASHLRLWKAPGEADGYRYIEFVGVSVDLNRRLCNSDASVDVLIELSDIPDGAGRIALVENAALFASANPLASSRIIEIGGAIFDGFNLTKDCVALMTPGTNAWSNVVAWGSGADDLRAKHENSPDPDEFSEEWPGNNIATPDAGEILRYAYNASASQRRDHFQSNTLEHVLYDIGDGEDPYLLIELTGMGLSLESDISSGSPATGEALYLVDAGGNRATGGLDSNGLVQVGTEQISYSARGDQSLTVSARGANATTAAAHVAGDQVLMVDPYDDVATDGVPIRQIIWRRPTGSTTLRDFVIRRSGLETVRIASDDNHEDDYQTLATVTANSATTYTLTPASTVRCRYILLEIGEMSVDPARPRLNEFEAILDEDYYPSSSWLTGSNAAGDVIARILENGGVPGGAILVNGGTASVEGFSTARDACLTVAADLADYTGCRVTIARDGTVDISASTIWTAGSHTPVATWTRSDVRRVELVQATNRAISQVLVPWRLPDNSDSGEARYPAAPVTAYGTPLRLNDGIYATEGAAQNAARRHYLQQRYPWRFVLEMADALTTLRPGVVYALTWQFDRNQPAMTRQLLLIEVEHSIERGAWKTTAVGMQIDRESSN